MSRIFSSKILIKMNVKINLRSITKKHEAYSEIRFSTKLILKPFRLMSPTRLRNKIEDLFRQSIIIYIDEKFPYR